VSQRRAGLPPPDGYISARTPWRLDRPLQLFQRVQWAIGQRLSVRAKLTIWYGVMCALTLTLVGLGMKTALDYRTTSSLDPNLQHTAQRVAQQLSEAEFSGPAIREAKSSQNPFARYPDVNHCSQEVFWYCVLLKTRLFDLSGTYDSPGVTEQVAIISQGPASMVPAPGSTGSSLPIITPGRRQPVHLTAASDPISLMLFVSRLERKGAQFLTVHDRGQTFRVYVTQLPLPASLQQHDIQGLLEVMQNEHTYLEVQRDLNLILVIGLPLGVIVALLAGWWIARAALRPIDRISRTVRSVGDSQDLGRRVNFVGPEDEVGRLAATFDAMLERLESAFEQQKRFIADASHELRTPLTAIRGNADLMVIAPASERELCLSAIRRESERMSRLVSDLLVLAEADVAEQQVQMQHVDLQPMMQEVYRSALLVASDRVDVLIEDNERVSIMADADRVKQLMLNLADNAVKFTPDGGTISLSLRDTPNGAIIEVADSGIGIPADEQAAIFGRFYRVEASRSRRGSGLGLAICAWIVQAHEGTISVRSEPGKGSTFTVFLPGRVDLAPLSTSEEQRDLAVQA
jgi:signal transduction histidine kinase